MPTAAAAFFVGVESAQPFAEAVLGTRGTTFPIKPNSGAMRDFFAIAILLIAVIGMTFYSFACVIEKWLDERKHPSKKGKLDFADLACEDGVSYLAFSLAISVFACGFFAPFLFWWQVAALVSIVATPTILQLIDLHGQRRGT